MRELVRQLNDIRALTRATPVEKITKTLAAHQYVRTGQISGEFLEFMRILQRRAVRNVLEIGTLMGGTLVAFSRIAVPGSLLVSVDNALKDKEWRKAALEALALPQQTIRILEMDSQKEITRDRAKELFGGETVDLLFIDGGHNYECVRRDYELYGPLVQPGGLIAFHDIAHPGTRGGSKGGGCGVGYFWRELKEQALPGITYREVVRSWQQGWGGIGILVKAAQ